ncbi:MAG: hypothetical protein U0350_27685 [Caldilineaceae bacterium]
MKRYLLFDSGCSFCTGAAKDIEMQTEGWLTAWSLRDPKVKTILDKIYPGWKWEPMVLKIDDDDEPQVYRGTQMAFYLLRELGPFRVLRMSQTLGSMVSSVKQPQKGRRRFMQSASGLLAGLAIIGLSPYKLFAGDDGDGSKVYLPIVSANQNNVQFRTLSDAEAKPFVDTTLHSVEFQNFAHKLDQERKDLALDAENPLVAVVNEKTVLVRVPVSSNITDSFFGMAFDYSTQSMTGTLYSLFELNNTQNVSATIGYEGLTFEMLLTQKGDILGGTVVDAAGKTKTIAEFMKTNSTDNVQAAGNNCTPWQCFDICFDCRHVPNYIQVAAGLVCSAACAINSYACFTCLAIQMTIYAPAVGYCGGFCYGCSGKSCLCMIC